MEEIVGILSWKVLELADKAIKIRINMEEVELIV
jgi:hypothetical protein